MGDELKYFLDCCPIGTGSPIVFALTPNIRLRWRKVKMNDAGFLVVVINLPFHTQISASQF
jgi:hypothetical protein